MTDIAIRVENLSKLYHIGVLQQRHDTLRDALSARVRRNPKSQIENPKSDELWALRDVSFEVKRGEVVGIIGRNGAGKSTLLKILSRITEPTSGRAEIHGRVGSLLEVGTGFHPELTGRENIYLNGAILGMRRTEIDRQFDEIVAFAEIEKFLETPVKRYSSGMYVRLAFAVAAHLEPEILVVDEVLAVGDMAFQKKCLGRMSEVGKAGRTVLFVSHNMAAIENLCARATLLERGRMIASGRTTEIINLFLQSTHESAGLTSSHDASNSLVRVLSMGPVDAGGQPLHYIRCGEDLNLALALVSTVAVPNATVTVGFTSHYDTRVAVLHSGISGYTISLKKGENFVHCRVDRFPLVPGTYSLDMALFGEDQPIVWAPMQAALTVEAADYFHTGRLPDASWAGFVLLPQQWYVHNNGEHHYPARLIDSD